MGGLWRSVQRNNLPFGRSGTIEKVIYIEKKQYLVDRAVENNLREAGFQVLLDTLANFFYERSMGKG